MKAAKPKTLKRSNRKTILDYLRNSEEITVNDIHKAVGLSKTTVMKIVTYYAEKGFVVDIGKGESTDEGGKKPNLYRFNEGYGYAIGTHIFPEELYFVAADLRLKILKDLSIPIKQNEKLDKVVEEIKRGVEELISDLEPASGKLIGIAIGSHGITNYEEGTVYISPHFPSWGENVPLRQMLTDALQLPVELFIDNQIRFQVFAEQTIGIAADKRNIIVIEGGEGLVAGIIVKNEIKRGVHYVAGEIGHMVIDPSDEEVCSCGGLGCFEVLVSTKRLLARAAEMKAESLRNEKVRAGTATSPLFEDNVLETEGVDAIFRLSNRGDPAACTIMDEAIRWFSIGVSNIMLMHDPEIIIIQGAYSAAGDYFLSSLREQVNSCVLVKMPKSVEIQYSKLGKERGALGGAIYAINEYFSKELLYAK